MAKVYVKLILFLLLAELVYAGYAGCVDVDICDEYSIDYNSAYPGTISCTSSVVSNADVHEVFTIFYQQRYICDGTETFNFVYTFHTIEETDDNYRFHNRTFDYRWVSSYPSAGYAWNTWAGIIHDLNSAYGSQIDVEFEIYNDTVGVASCPVDDYTVTPTGTTWELNQNDKGIFKPYPSMVEQITERAFEPISGLIMVDYFLDDESIALANQQDYINAICGDDVCKDLNIFTPDITDEVTTHLLYDTYTVVDEATSFGGTTLKQNLTKALIYHFNATKTPIYALTSIEWTWYKGWNGSSPAKFRGNHYAFVILGYEESSDTFLMQYPDGARYGWQPSFLNDTWGYTDYNGFFITMNAGILNTANLIITKDDNSTPIIGDILIKDYNYYLCINDTPSSWYYPTNDSRLKLDVDNTWHGNESHRCHPTKIDTSSAGDFSFNYDIQGKSGTVSDIIYYSVIDPMNFSAKNYSPFVIYTNTPASTFIYDTNFYGDTFCNMTALTGANLTNYNSNDILNHSCAIASTGFFGAGETIEVNIRSCEANYGICIYDTLSPPTRINYAQDLNPIISSNCALESNCTLKDSENTTFLGSWETYNNLFKNQEIEEYSVNFDFYNSDTDLSCLFSYTDSPYNYPNYNTYTWDIETNCSYEELGLYYIEVCLNPNYDDEDCDYFAQNIKDTFWGKTGSTGSVTATENSSSMCEYTLSYNSSKLAPCQEERLIHYWFDVDEDLNFEATANFDGNLTYINNPDCADKDCIVNLNRSSYDSASYCIQHNYTGYSNYTLSQNNATFSDGVDLYVCYDSSAWNDCDCYKEGYSWNDWIDSWNHTDASCSTTISIDEPPLTGHGDVDCQPVYEGALSGVDYQICNKRQIYDNDAGRWCVKARDLDLSCSYDCSSQDFDNDGVNDCLDVCCGYNDTANADGDAFPDACDPCPTLSLHNDSDGDGYFDCLGTCSDGVKNLDETAIDYGGLCGTCKDKRKSLLLGETEVDYGGKCGNCSTTGKLTDVIWLAIPNRLFPFTSNQCKEGEGTVTVISTFIVVLILIMGIFIIFLFLIIILPFLFFGVTLFGLIRRFFGKKKRKI